MKGINDDEYEDMVAFCLEHGFTLRFIETMPMGDTGREASDHYLALQQELANTEDRIQAARRFYNGNGQVYAIQLLAFVVIVYLFSQGG